jgi:hypothetical protein
MKMALMVPVFFYCSLVWGEDVSRPSESTAVRTAFKLVTSYYQSSDGNNALDTNIRGNRGSHAGWIGYYRDQNDYRQARTGYEFTQDFPLGQVVWSAQAASGGFLGGSINAQLGSAVYGIAGFGRTNLKNYYNLNFDPNDAITLGIGTRVLPETDLSLYQIWDDRLGTKQHVTHLYLHHNLSKVERFSIDGSYKSGLNSDNDFIRGYALTVTYAYRQYFIRLAHDQHANFGTSNQNRFSMGITF